MEKILLIFGTRPEAIKMAPLVKEFQKYPNRFDVRVCVTAQHRELLDQVLSIFEIDADVDLDIMQEDQDLYDIFTRVLNGIKRVLLNDIYDIVFVQGDTITSTAAALASFFQKIPVAHVEAGLRTNNIYSPWPEEINRQLTGRIATYHFAPTNAAKENLLKENIGKDKIFVTGNTVIDALQSVVNKIKLNQTLQHEVMEDLKSKGYDPNRLSNCRKLILITGHRRENFGYGLENICKAIKILSEKNPNVDFVYPVHLNPNVQKPVRKILGQNGNICNIFLLSPLEYLPFIFLMNASYLILTDSGGIQEEAPALGKPVLVMRENTERPEAIQAGTAKLVGTNIQNIVDSVIDLLLDKSKYLKMSLAINPYGDGTASKKIVEYFLVNEY